MQVTRVFLSAVILAVCVTAVPIGDNRRAGRLRIIEAGHNSLQAIFYTAETGIRIVADSNLGSLISMTDGEILLSGKRPHGSSLLASVVGSSFLQYTTTLETGEQEKVEFVVPDSLVEQMKEAIETRKEARLLSQLNRDETETTRVRETAFERLFARPEIRLLESAAHALGNAGIMGRENQGALNFYGVVKTVVKLLYKESAESRDGGEAEMQYEDEATRFKRAFCSNNGYYCNRCPVGSQCVGMCGPGCSWCWSFVCGSCCYHQGCYDHDICCGRDGYFSWSCIFIIGFSCSGYNC